MFYQKNEKGFHFLWAITKFDPSLRRKPIKIIDTVTCFLSVKLSIEKEKKEKEDI